MRSEVESPKADLQDISSSQLLTERIINKALNYVVAQAKVSRFRNRVVHKIKACLIVKKNNTVRSTEV